MEIPKPREIVQALRLGMQFYVSQRGRGTDLMVGAALIKKQYQGKQDSMDSFKLKVVIRMLKLLMNSLGFVSLVVIAAIRSSVQQTEIKGR
uniref:AlNc14C28G2679 protein n=1 Tax=Albugo laibachii Nc14 TaxID=890382 RepID=F0W750_9STRA|nr:AlNc14C28G2679 [Albugo laibachii Nc14]|eukprot:CCA16949.1 AlNc14C28G2679 [Albugo laibachii Nc14]